MMMIPIIAILTRHQQKMTEMLQRSDAPTSIRQTTESQILAELTHLRRRMDDLTIAVEQVKDQQSPIRELESRINR